MIAIVRASGRRLSSAARSLLAAGAALSLAGLVQAQSIRIPDFSTERPAVTTLRPGETCDNCGAIRSIREIRSERPIPAPKSLQSEATDGGMGSSGLLVGAVAVLPMGEGSGRSYVGGVGTPEMRSRFTETSYEITVRLDNGSFTVVQRSDGAQYRVGDRVRVQGIQLELVNQ
jgi:outer membrane lipoprotein SlyB